MSHSKNPHSWTASKGTFSHTSKENICTCNSIENEESLEGLIMSLKNIKSESIDEDEKKEYVFLKGLSIHEKPISKTDDKQDIKDIRSSRTLKEPDEDFQSVSDMISFTDCGEPMPTQYLRLDFHPIKKFDTDKFRSKKCVDFWNFINEHPELKPLKVEAEPFDYDKTDTSVPFSETPSSVSTETPGSMALSPTTLQTLKWLGKDRVMTDSLATKAEREPCEPECQGYFEYSNKRIGNWPEIGKKELERKTLSSRLRRPPGKDVASKNQPVDDLVKMMADMYKWDLEHPKSLDPPVHEKLPRKRRIAPYIEKNEDILCEKCLQ